jgi:hypothetical protein
MNRRDFFRAFITLVLGSWLGVWDCFWAWLSRRVIRFNSIALPKFTKEVDELRTWNTDIRQILADNCVMKFDDKTRRELLENGYRELNCQGE